MDQLEGICVGCVPSAHGVFDALELLAKFATACRDLSVPKFHRPIGVNYSDEVGAKTTKS